MTPHRFKPTFKAFPDIVIPDRATRLGWEDVSWVNNSAPHMTHRSEDKNGEGNAVEIWINDQETILETLGEAGSLYWVFKDCAGDQGVALYTGNDLDMAIDIATAEVIRRLEEKVNGKGI